MGHVRPLGQAAADRSSLTWCHRVHLHLDPAVSGVAPRHEIAAAEMLAAGDDDASGTPVVHDSTVDLDADRATPRVAPLVVRRHSHDDHVHRDELHGALRRVTLHPHHVAWELEPMRSHGGAAAEPDGSGQVGARRGLPRHSDEPGGPAVGQQGRRQLGVGPGHGEVGWTAGRPAPRGAFLDRHGQGLPAGTPDTAMTPR